VSVYVGATTTAFAADNAELEYFFNNNSKQQMQLCGVCHAPNGLADVEGGDRFLLYPNQSQYDSFYDAWVALGKGVTNNRLLTMNSDPALNHTGLQNWPTSSLNYQNVKTLLTCWDEPIACTIAPTIDSADLSISTTGNNGQNDGGSIRYTILVANAGPNSADAIEIVHQLPAQVSLSEVAPDAIAYTANGSEITFYLDSLAKGSSQAINVTVNTAVSNNSKMSFSSMVNAITADPNLANNSISAMFGGGVTTENADLSVSMAGHNGKNQDGIIRYSITVKNAGPTAANALEISHLLPSQVELSTVSPSEIAYTAEGNEVNFYLDTLATGTSRTIDIEVSTATNNKTKMNFTSVVTSATEDPNSANNTKTVKFGGSFGWLLSACLGILLFSRSLRKQSRSISR